jgi:hypothetical protein
MKLKFDRAGLQRDTKTLRFSVNYAARQAMEKTIKQAARDAKGLVEWRAPGEQAEVYGDTLWEWTTTGSAAKSIQGYVVPNKNLQQFSTQTTSYRNGQPLSHPHYTDDTVTDNHSVEKGKIAGVLTMNIHYAPYLQEWEEDNGGVVVEEVLDANWDANYVPTIIEPTMAKALDNVVTGT